MSWHFTKRRKRLYYCATGVCVVYLLLNYSSLNLDLPMAKCSVSESQEFIQQLCTHYHDDAVAGSLCSDLCHRKTLVFVDCLSHQKGKQVYLMRWNGLRVIFKSMYAAGGATGLALTLSGDGRPDVEDFARLVGDHLRLNLPGDTSDLAESGPELVSRMWSLDFAQLAAEWRRDQDDHGRASSLVAAMDSVWSLMLQEEYRLLQYYGGQKPLPRVLGTCGQFYAVEYLPPGVSLAPGLLEVTSLRRAPWRQRAFTAVAILDAVSALENRFVETLHMCDMKGENFGIAADGSVKAIDVDTAIFNTRLKSDLASPNCTSNAPCDFFDCRGWCDVTRGRCTPLRINNNLQSLCYKVFLGHEVNGFHGLLDSPPPKYREEILRALADCSHPPRPRDLRLPGCQRTGGDLKCPPSQLPLDALTFKADDELFNSLLELLIMSVRDYDAALY